MTSVQCYDSRIHGKLNELDAVQPNQMVLEIRARPPSNGAMAGSVSPIRFRGFSFWRAHVKGSLPLRRVPADRFVGPSRGVVLRFLSS